MEKDKTIVDNTLKEIKKHGTNEFPLAIYEDNFRNFENGAIRYHWHDEIQFSYVLEEPICFDIETDHFVLNGGEAVFINSQAFHQIAPVNSYNGEIYSFVLNVTFLESSYMSEVYTNCILPYLKNGCKYIILTPKQTALLLDIKRHYDLKLPCYPLKIKVLICELWYDLMHNRDISTALTTRQEKHDRERVQRAISYMNNHYQEQLSLEDIANYVMISKSELCRCFKRALNTTPFDYLIKHRVLEAARLLSITDKKIAEIAQETGFDSTSHMGRFFHKHMGCSPSAVRKSYF